MLVIFRGIFMPLHLIMASRLALSKRLILARGAMPPRGLVVHGGPVIQRGLVFPGRVIARSIQTGLLALLAVGWHPPALAGVMGAASPLPYPVAVERSRQGPGRCWNAGAPRAVCGASSAGPCWSSPPVVRLRRAKPPSAHWPSKRR